MKVMIAAVGRPSDRALASLLVDYETRTRRYFELEVVEVSPPRGWGRRFWRERGAVFPSRP